MVEPLDPRLAAHVANAPHLDDPALAGLRPFRHLNVRGGTATSTYHSDLACLLGAFMRPALSIVVKEPKRSKRGDFREDLTMVCYTQAVVYFAVTTGNLELVTGNVGAHIAAVLDQHRPGMSEPLGILKRSGQPADDWVAAGAAGARLLEAAAERCGAKTLSVEESLLVIAAMPNAAMYGREMVELHLNVKLSQLVAPIRIVK